MICLSDTLPNVGLRQIRVLLMLMGLCSLTLLSGCQPPDTLQYRFDDYQKRVASLLDSDIPENTALPAIRYPEKRLRIREIPVFEQGLVEVWDFQRCELMELINRRNSGLGKVLATSQRYVYENEFWQKLVPCYEKRDQWQQEDSDFVQRLEQLYAHKQAIAPAVFHQMLFNGPELENQFNVTQSIFLPMQPPEHHKLSAALDQMITLSQAPMATSVSGSELEQTLQVIYQQPILLSLLRTLQLSVYELNQTAQLLEEKIARRPLCLTGQPTQKARNLFNVLQKYYLTGIQPDLASHNKIASALLPTINQLFLYDTKYKHSKYEHLKYSNTGSDDAIAEDSGNSALEAFRLQWLDQNAPGLWQDYQQANRRHTHIWNKVLRSCGLFPSR